MKKFFICTFVLLCAIGVSSGGIRVKRGLTPEEKKKLVIALNADRRNLGMKHNETFKALKYDIELEQQVEALESGGKCSDPGDNFVPLKVDSHTREMMEKDSMMPPPNKAFFDPRNTKIGCSTKYTCSFTFPNDDRDKEIAGKTITVYGLCLLTPKNNKPSQTEGTQLYISQSEVPDINKYGDLLGVAESSEGSSESLKSASKLSTASTSSTVFSLTVFLSIRFYYL